MGGGGGGVWLCVCFVCVCVCVWCVSVGLSLCVVVGLFSVVVRVGFKLSLILGLGHNIKPLTTLKH